MDTTTCATLLVGFALGLKHATEADHVVAVSTMVTDESGARRCVRVGVLWGLGHLLTVVAAGGLVVVLRIKFPPTVQWALELVVALMLVGLGLRTLLRTFHGRYHFHVHQHGFRAHAHLHFHARGESLHEHASHTGNALGALARRSGPLLVGMAHGLAGTAGLALLVLGSIPSRTLGVLYLVVFGLGALTGMAGFSALASLPLARASKDRSCLRWLDAMQFAAGAGSSILGVVLTHRAFLSPSCAF